MGRAYPTETWDAAGTAQELFGDETVRATLVVAAADRLMAAAALQIRPDGAWSGGQRLEWSIEGGLHEPNGSSHPTKLDCGYRAESSRRIARIPFRGLTDAASKQTSEQMVTPLLSPGRSAMLRLMPRRLHTRSDP